MVSRADRDANLEQAATLISEAVAQNAEFVLLPENFALMGQHERDKLAIGEPPGQGPLQEFLGETARRHRIWLAGGTIPLSAKTPEKARSACLLFDPDGNCVARYDKIHLFDVELDGERREVYRESNTVEAGDTVVTVPTPLARIGLSVCYDLRFPELYRRMLSDDVQLVAVPSAFTEDTGQAHWHTLLRARAVENLCYFAAANQGGIHPNGRSTYGHSLIVDPWGEILAESGTGPAVIVADLDLQRLETLRRRFPVLEHRRLEYRPE